MESKIIARWNREMKMIMIAPSTCAVYTIPLLRTGLSSRIKIQNRAPFSVIINISVRDNARSITVDYARDDLHVLRITYGDAQHADRWIVRWFYVRSRRVKRFREVKNNDGESRHSASHRIEKLRYTFSDEILPFRFTSRQCLIELLQRTDRNIDDTRNRITINYNDGRS